MSTLTTVPPIAKGHSDFMTHEKIIASFMEHPESRLILDRPHGSESDLYWSGVMKAHFSRKYNSGASAWDGRFESKKIGGEYAFRMRKNKT